ncbi:MAG: cadherin-like beta sandwich domain-containing protein, partial [Chloroflexi bacterium]|nr:cadherin-like beta sandwich domain-containing protein [Chloroflexota bacterium]
MKKLARIAMLLAVALCAAAGATDADARNVSLSPSFDPETLTYTATVPNDVSEVVVDLAAEHPKATVTVNGGDPAAPVQLAVGETTIVIVVTAEDKRFTRTYTVVVTREAARSSNALLAG